MRRRTYELTLERTKQINLVPNTTGNQRKEGKYSIIMMVRGVVVEVLAGGRRLD